MLTRADLKIAILECETFSREGRSKDQLAKMDIAIGLLYEAYAQMTLDEKHLNVDVTSICGFVRYINAINVNFTRSARVAPITIPAMKLAA